VRETGKFSPHLRFSVVHCRSKSTFVGNVRKRWFQKAFAADLWNALQMDQSKYESIEPLQEAA